MADIEGAPEVANVFRNTAEGETGHAHGHMEYLIDGGSGDPETGLAAGNVAEALESAIAGETHEYTDMYPGMAKAAREEGFDEIADWFETLAKAELSAATRTNSRRLWKLTKQRHNSASGLELSSPLYRQPPRIHHE